MSEFQKILIIRFSSVGDIILTSPVVRGLRRRYPEAQIDLLTKTAFADLYRHNPHLDRVLTFDGKGGISALHNFAAELRKEGYDRLVDLHNNLRSNYIRKTVRAKKTTVYTKDYFRRYALLTLRIRLKKTVRPTYLRYFDAVKTDGITYDGAGTELFFRPEILDSVKEKLALAGYSGGALAAVCPGASYPTKQWSPEGFTEVAGRLISEKQTFVIFVGGPDETEMCNKMCADLPAGRSANFAGSLSLEGSAALLSLCNQAFTNDSGMLHAAQAVGCPVTAIYGCTSEELGFFPLPQKSRVVQVALSCRPCTHNGRETCPKGHFQCMKAIRPEDVLDN